jgi:hypothetical protein
MRIANILFPKLLLKNLDASYGSENIVGVNDYTI